MSVAQVLPRYVRYTLATPATTVIVSYIGAPHVIFKYLLVSSIPSHTNLTNVYGTVTTFLSKQ